MGRRWREWQMCQAVNSYVARRMGGNQARSSCLSSILTNHRNKIQHWQKLATSDGSYAQHLFPSVSALLFELLCKLRHLHRHLLDRAIHPINPFDYLSSIGSLVSFMCFIGEPPGVKSVAVDHLSQEY